MLSSLKSQRGLKALPTQGSILKPDGRNNKGAPQSFSLAGQREEPPTVTSQEGEEGVVVVIEDSQQLPAPASLADCR